MIKHRAEKAADIDDDSPESVASAVRPDKGRAPAVMGVVCLGALVTLAVVDLLDPEVGEWWAQRPMLAASASGLLLLAVTVLVVQALLQRAAQRRWRGPIAPAVERIRKPVADLAFWSQWESLAGESGSLYERRGPRVRGMPLLSHLLLDRGVPGENDGRWWQTLPLTVEQATADAAPLLMAADFGELLESAHQLTRAVTGLAKSVAFFFDVESVAVEDKDVLETDARFGFHWPVFVDALWAFDCRCHDDLGLERRVDDRLLHALKHAQEIARAPTDAAQL
jgi:hypothetical protein